MPGAAVQEQGTREATGPGGRQEQESALPPVASGCALPICLEAEEDTRTRSARGCLHVLPCFPGWGGGRRPGFG